MAAPTGDLSVLYIGGTGTMDMIRWRAGHAEQCRPAPGVDAIIDRLVAGYHSAREVFTALGAATQRADHLG